MIRKDRLELYEIRVSLFYGELKYLWKSRSFRDVVHFSVQHHKTTLHMVKEKKRRPGNACTDSLLRRISNQLKKQTIKINLVPVENLHPVSIIV